MILIPTCEDKYCCIINSNLPSDLFSDQATDTFPRGTIHFTTLYGSSSHILIVHTRLEKPRDNAHKRACSHEVTLMRNDNKLMFILP